MYIYNYELLKLNIYICIFKYGTLNIFMRR